MKDIKEKRQLVRDMDQRIITLLKARMDLAQDLDTSIQTELGLDPLNSAYVEISILNTYMKTIGFNAAISEHVSDFLVHYMR